MGEIYRPNRLALPPGPRHLPGWTSSSATPSGSHAVLTIPSPSPCLSLALTTSRISLGRFPIQVLPPRPGGPPSAGSLACEFTRPLRDNLICRHLIRMSFLTDFHARNPACDLDRLVDVRLRPDEAAQLDHALERFDVDLVDLPLSLPSNRIARPMPDFTRPSVFAGLP